MVIITNGTLLAIQNMTWAGKLGFQNKPNQTVINNLTEIQYADVLSDAGYGDYLGPQGVMGIQVCRVSPSLLWISTKWILGIRLMGTLALRERIVVDRDIPIGSYAASIST